MTASALLRRITASSAILFSTIAYGQTKPQSPIGALLDELGKTKHIGPVALAPDGKTVAMVLGYTLTLQPVARSGAAQTPSICPKAQDPQIASLAWSPDGAHLAVLATCGDSLGVYLVDAPEKASGIAPARRLAELHGFAKELEYSPDGLDLGFLYVKGATRPSGALAAMKPPSGVIGVEGLEVQGFAQMNASTGESRIVTPENLHVYEFSWAPDSQQVAYVAAPPPGENNWWVAKLYTESVKGHTPSSANQPNMILDPSTVAGPLHGLQIAVPRWSPDGKQIAFIGGLMSDQGATGGDLYLLPSDGSGGPLDVTPDSTTTMEWIDWLPSGKLLATKLTGGSERVDEITFDPMPAQHATPGDSLSVPQAFQHHTFFEQLAATIGDGRLDGSFTVSRDGRVAAWASSSYSQAAEVYAGPLDGSPLPQITHLNSDRKPTWGKAESVRWTNENFNVQGWLFYPANYDPSKKYPMIVMVHGGPSSAVVPRWPGAGFGAAPFSAMGYFVLEPNPRGSYGEGEAFTQANRKDFGYGDLRDILAGVDAVEKKLPIDDHRIGVTGWSYGGFMTMFTVTQTQRFRAAVAGAGISDWLSYYGENSIDQWMTPFFGASVYDDPAVYAKSSAINYIKQVKTPTLVVVGDRDGECPAPQSFEFWHALKAEDVATELVVYPNEGHGFSDPAHRRDVIERAVAWFDKYMQ